MLKAVLFDADGVLFDACELHFEALNLALEAYGFAISREEHLERYNGLPTRVKLGMLSEERGLPLAWHSVIEELKQRHTMGLIDSHILPDVRKRALLRDVRGLGLRTGVCSNARRVSVERMLQAAGLRDLVDVVLGNEDVPRPKPAPDIYLLGAVQVGVPVSECAIVEDSPVGLRAAFAADPFVVVAVTSPEEVDLSLLARLPIETIPEERKAA